MLGAIVRYNSDRKAAEAYRLMARLAMEAQEDAADRALAEMPYIGWVYPPPVQKINGKWYAVVERPPSVPRVKRK